MRLRGLATGAAATQRDTDMGEVTRSGRIHLAGRETNELAMEWLSGVDEPFFAWVHYFEPHSPYRPTPHSSELLKSYSGPHAEGISVSDFGAGDWMRSTAETAALRTLYDGEVKEADTLFGELLELLDARGALDRTLVVFTADHGQALGDHGRPGHGAILWQSVLRVPLVLWQPWDRTARRVADRVGLVDLMPTLAELLGLRPSTAVQGRSLAPALRSGSLPEVRYFAEVRYLPNAARRQAEAARLGVVPKNRHGLPRATNEDLAVFLGRYKWIEDAVGGKLYDLEVDPGELAPLSGERYADMAEKMRALAEEFRAAPLAAGQTESELNEDLVKELRALGYL